MTSLLSVIMTDSIVIDDIVLRSEINPVAVTSLQAHLYE